MSNIQNYLESQEDFTQKMLHLEGFAEKPLPPEHLNSLVTQNIDDILACVIGKIRSCISDAPLPTTGEQLRLALQEKHDKAGYRSTICTFTAIMYEVDLLTLSIWRLLIIDAVEETQLKKLAEKKECSNQSISSLIISQKCIGEERAEKILEKLSFRQRIREIVIDEGGLNHIDASLVRRALPYLDTLTIKSNKFDCDIPNLNGLRLTPNKISWIEDYTISESSLHQLVVLEISNNAIDVDNLFLSKQFIKRLSSIPNLFSLSIGNSCTPDNSCWCRDEYEIEKPQCTECIEGKQHQLGIKQLLPQLKHMKSIRKLEITGCDLRDQDVKTLVASFKDLRSLTLRWNQSITNATASYLCRECSALIELDISQTAISAAAYDEICESMPYLQTLYCNQLTLKQFGSLNVCTRKRILQIGRCGKGMLITLPRWDPKETESTLQLLERTPKDYQKVKELDLAWTPIEDRGMAVICFSLPNLTKASFLQNKITGEGSQHLSHLKSLEHLSYNNGFSLKTAQALSNMTRLVSLRLSIKEQTHIIDIINCEVARSLLLCTRLQYLSMDRVHGQCLYTLSKHSSIVELDLSMYDSCFNREDCMFLARMNSLKIINKRCQLEIAVRMADRLGWNNDGRYNNRR